MIARARHTPAKAGTITRYSATPLLAALVATMLASVLYRANRAVLLSRSRCDGWTDATLSHQEDDPSAKLMQSGTKTHPSTPIASRPLVRNSSVSDRAFGIRSESAADALSPVDRRASLVIVPEILLLDLLLLSIFSANVMIGAANENANTKDASHGTTPSIRSNQGGQTVLARRANQLTHKLYSPAYRFIQLSSITPLRGLGEI